MPYVLRESSNTAELTIALYFTWNEGEVIFTFTALPRFGTPCETIQLFHSNGYYYVNFQSTAWTSETVIAVARYFYKDAHSCFMICIEAATRRSSVKKVFLEISQNSQEKTCARVSF